MVAGVVTFTVSPSGLSTVSSRLIVEADSFAHFRVKSLKFRLHRPSTLANAQAMGYVGGVQDTLPGSIGNIVELLPSTYMEATETVPSAWVVVSPKDLAGPLPWYKSVAGAADATEEAPGVLCLGGTTTDAYSFEIKGVLEFKTAVSTSNSPAEYAARLQRINLRMEQARKKARDRLFLTTGSPGLP